MPTTTAGDGTSGTWRLVDVKVRGSKFYIFSDGIQRLAVSSRFFWGHR